MNWQALTRLLKEAAERFPSPTGAVYGDPVSPRAKVVGTYSELKNYSTAAAPSAHRQWKPQSRSERHGYGRKPETEL